MRQALQCGLRGKEKMRTAWILAILPVLAYARGECLICPEDDRDEVLHHIERDAETIEEAAEGLSLLEMDERDPSLLPWVTEELVIENFEDLFDRKTAQADEEVEDVFSYDLPCYGKNRSPSYEKIPATKRRLL